MAHLFCIKAVGCRPCYRISPKNSVIESTYCYRSGSFWVRLFDCHILACVEESGEVSRKSHALISLGKRRPG